MSENIRVSEVSDILRQQLEGIETKVQLDEIGTVLQVSDGVVRIYGLRNAEANELLEFDNGIKAIVMNLEEDNVGAVLLGPTDKIKEGFTVKRTKRIASIRVGESMLGRVIDPLGEPLDGKGGELYEMPLERKAPGVIYRQPVNQPLQTGLKAVDAMIPIGRGQRELIIGDRQTGKTSIAIDTIINQRSNYEAGDPVYCIYVAIGQKGSTVASIVNANMVRWIILLWWRLQLETRLHCNILLRLRGLPSVSIFVIPADMHWLFMMICRNKQYLTVKCL